MVLVPKKTNRDLQNVVPSAAIQFSKNKKQRTAKHSPDEILSLSSFAKKVNTEKKDPKMHG